MSIELPSEPVWIMNLMGINWPDVDGDQMREWAQHVRDFAKGLTDAHEGTDVLLKNLGASYEGASYEALLSRWGQASGGHMTVLIDGCGVLATGLEIAADAVIVAKGAIVEVGKRIVNAIIQQIENEVVGELVSTAIEPFQQAIENAVSGLVFHGVEAALGVGGGA